MGPLAGPVVAAAVVLPVETHIDGVADSKVLSAAVRELLATEIRRRALGVGIAVVEPEEIDRVNIYQAGLRALRRAVERLRPLVPGFVLVDGREIPGLGIPQSAYPKGDAFVTSIAAASIVAKCHRDALMRELDAIYPVYGFGRHMGYATREPPERAPGPRSVARAPALVRARVGLDRRRRRAPARARPARTALSPDRRFPQVPVHL